MTKLLDQALQVARRLPPDAQDDIARLILQLAGVNDEAEPVPLSVEERAAIDASKRAAARGEFASEDEVEAVWAKYGL
jgi:predicted transcriptional regulator